MRSRYSLKVIEQLELEKEGMIIHLSWLERTKRRLKRENEDETKINQQIEEERHFYDKYEYYRRASIGKAIYEKVLRKLDVSFSDDIKRQENEHMRWNAFMRAEGYIYDRNKKDHIAKTHPDLKSNNRLKPFEREKDLILSEEELNIK
jgi:hypothetical protein